MIRVVRVVTGLCTLNIGFMAAVCSIYDDCPTRLLMRRGDEQAHAKMSKSHIHKLFICVREVGIQNMKNIPLNQKDMNLRG